MWEKLLKILSWATLKANAGATITSLFIQGGVKEEWEIEETYNRASLLTLTGIKKGPKNRGKGKEKETEEGKRKEGCIELEQWENQCPLQSEAQRS